MTGGKGHLFQQQHWLLSWDFSMNKADTHRPGSLCFSGLTFIYFHGVSPNEESSIIPFAFLMGTLAGALRLVRSSTAAPTSAAPVPLPRSAPWQGTHALPPHGDMQLLPLLPILIVYAIKKPSEYQGDDLSLVPQYFQKHQVLNQGVWRNQCLFCKRSSTNWAFLLMLTYNDSYPARSELFP